MMVSHSFSNQKSGNDHLHLNFGRCVMYICICHSCVHASVASHSRHVCCDTQQTCLL